MNYRKSAHSLYELQYHIVFCTKYRYRVLNGDIANRCRDLIREICSANYVDIVSGNVSPDHIHILISVPPHLAVSKIVQYIKGKSSRKLQQEFEVLRKRYCGQHLWARGYFAVTTGTLNTSDVQKYIEQQEEHHRTDSFKISEF
jgi:putative transposase